MKIQLDIDEEYEEALVIIKSKEMTEEISEILKKLKSIKKRNVIGLENEKIYILNPDDILVIYSKDQKVFVDTINKTYEVKKRLYELEDELRGESFVRISKFAIANVDKIRNIEVVFNGNLVVNFINGRKETISRRYLQKVKDFIGMGGR
ncbi:LytTR family DNA-binding domain-containing protein [Eubacterium multiforme]|uniref:DNA-binding LytR/AlgR family response regulator n=1 Tax=Eubacterium multiforme TaxID=83339 RepID=A0ABT9UY84_9FIRM|nr:LytTR family DNA-binding domain-containing protein [Eubacterium multiforme]MDQ0151285.1 DNA-binding LytR/AlgR family response regulator [Eubacterium multiforme]